MSDGPLLSPASDKVFFGLEEREEESASDERRARARSELGEVGDVGGELGAGDSDSNAPASESRLSRHATYAAWRSIFSRRSSHIVI